MLFIVLSIVLVIGGKSDRMMCIKTFCIQEGCRVIALAGTAARRIPWGGCIVAALLAAMPLARAAEEAVAMPPEMRDLARLYRLHASEIGARYRETIKGFPAQYTADLKALLDRYQQEGHLDGVLGAAQEQKRFAEAMRGERDPFELTPEMPAEAIVAEPPALRQLQENYVRYFKDAATARHQEIKDLTAKYLPRLEQLQRDLTRAGRIRDAVAVKREADRLNQAMTSGELAQLLAELEASLPAAAPPATNAAPAAAEIPLFGSVPNWARWTFARARRFSRERTQYDNPDVPDELYADFDARAGRGRVYGRCAIDTQQVGPVLSSWFGKALVWQVTDPATLTATFELESKEISAGDNHGPQAQLAVLAESVLLKALDVPLMERQTTLRIVKDPHSNRCALMWARGQVTETFELPAKGKISLLLGIAVRNPGERCDTAITLRP